MERETIIVEGVPITLGPVKREPKETVYPVAEYFISPQGEGLYTGTLMFFCRLAGCTVGRPYPKEAKLDQNHPAYLLPTYMEECRTIDGRSFSCDTNFKAKERLTAEEILNLVPDNVERFCITGGEPLMHDTLPLVTHALLKKKKVHVETSGTFSLVDKLPVHRREEIWVTCSPKYNALPEVLKAANELKILIDHDFKVEKMPDEVMNHQLVWIQPINNEMTLRPENLGQVMELQRQYPNWRISLQLHKVLTLYLNKIVR